MCSTSLLKLTVQVDYNLCSCCIPRTALSRLITVLDSLILLAEPGSGSWFGSSQTHSLQSLMNNRGGCVFDFNTALERTLITLAVLQCYFYFSLRL